jgi:hypothetical protein
VWPSKIEKAATNLSPVSAGISVTFKAHASQPADSTRGGLIAARRSLNSASVGRDGRCQLKIGSVADRRPGQVKGVSCRTGD